MQDRHGYGSPFAATVIAMAVVWSTACGGSDGDSTGPASPQPGALTVSVATAGSGGAAFLVTVTGDSITNPRAADNNHELHSNVSGRTLKAAVIGSVADGDDLLRFNVPDVNRASSYGVTLNQVAGDDNALQSTSDYTLTVNP